MNAKRKGFLRVTALYWFLGFFLITSMFLIYISFHVSENSNYYSIFGGTILGAVLGTFFGKISSEETNDEMHGINEKIDRLLSIYNFEFYEKLNSSFYFHLMKLRNHLGIIGMLFTNIIKQEMPTVNFGFIVG